MSVKNEVKSKRKRDWVYSFAGDIAWILNSVIAGMLIAIGGCANVIVGGPLGALLFAFGLLSVIGLKVNLFTGVAGNVSVLGIVNILMCWFGNFIGAAAIGGLFLLGHFECAQPLVIPGVGWETLVRAIFCGFIINICVSNQPIKYKDSENMVIRAARVILGVMLFVMCGFAHSIATMFYVVIARGDGLSGLALIAVVSIGNFIGCNIYPMIKLIIDCMEDA